MRKDETYRDNFCAGIRIINNYISAQSYLSILQRSERISNSSFENCFSKKSRAIQALLSAHTENSILQ